MQQTTQTNYYRESVIDLKDVINQLIASKKLIIGITLLSTILAFFYSSSKPPTFKSTALVEIGNYNLINVNENDGQNTLIESAEDLVQELKILFVHKKQKGVHSGGLSISIIEDRLIKIGIIAPSIEIGTNSLNKITSYILNRHENIIIGNTQRNLDLINTNLEQLNDEIEFNNERLKAKNEFLKAEINKRIVEISNKLPIIDKKISALELIISEDTANLRLLESVPKLLLERAAQYPTLNQEIHKYRNNLLDQENLQSSLKTELSFLKDSISEINIAFEKNISFNSTHWFSDNTFGDYTIKDDISSILFKLNQEKPIHEKELQLLVNQTPINSALIGEITSEQTNPKIMKFALIGFMFGMVLSIVLVLIIVAFKTYKEENAITL